MNRSGGPEDTSNPKANTAGTTTHADTSPAMVSKMATFFAASTTSTSRFR